MDIFSFTTIIVVLFIIIGGYLIFTNQIEGRAKMIIIIAVLVCFIYILMNLDMFKSYTESKSSPADASIIQTSTKVDTTSTSFSLSTWIYITDWNPGVTKTIFSGSDNCPTLTLGPNVNDLIINYETTSTESITIHDINIQKWVNIVICFGDNNVDSYINGKLVDSHINNGSVQKVSETASNTTLSWGGFTGYISSSRYYPYFLAPQEVWKIYTAGFSSNLLGNFLNQYNAKFTFSQNQVEKASFNII
jgi:hypothetical protein